MVDVNQGQVTETTATAIRAADIAGVSPQGDRFSRTTSQKSLKATPEKPLPLILPL